MLNLIVEKLMCMSWQGYRTHIDGIDFCNISALVYLALRKNIKPIIIVQAASGTTFRFDKH